MRNFDSVGDSVLDQLQSEIRLARRRSSFLGAIKNAVTGKVAVHCRTRTLNGAQIDRNFSREFLVDSVDGA